MTRDRARAGGVRDGNAGAPPPSRFNFAAAPRWTRNAGARAASSPTSTTAARSPTASLTSGVQRVGVRAARHSGLRREERVLVCLHDTIDFPVDVPRARCTRAWSRCASTRCSPSTTTRTCSSIRRAQALVVSGALLPTLTGDARARRTKCATSIVSRAGGDAPAGRARLRCAGSHKPTPPPPAAPHRRRTTIAFWLYSSGSTGRPKGDRAHARQPVLDGGDLRQARPRPRARTTSCSRRRSSSSRTGSATR